jgi:hypothetical protein
MRKTLVTWVLAVAPWLALADPSQVTHTFMDVSNTTTNTAWKSQPVYGYLEAVKVDVLSPNLTNMVISIATATNAGYDLSTSLFLMTNVTADLVRRPRFPVHEVGGTELSATTNAWERFCLTGECLDFRAYSANMTNYNVRVQAVIVPCPQ